MGLQLPYGRHHKRWKRRKGPRMDLRSISRPVEEISVDVSCDICTGQQPEGGTKVKGRRALTSVRQWRTAQPMPPAPQLAIHPPKQC
ncbi:unnamed protein product [Vitrella brassicaformis CCMP3155]|uniref:Uncharacterized protein n=1 Tax=Vitrella brassicaformis (strain CCMP3155) TaxID=1169540 RepID=A0A0G4FAV3_VITBC|nr:unnamed protein product [Vitrella brassicaformis CCMP3155]|eukprot:CEM10030.1 unnamed protein product [Vitrella brassicaformis CCMP3155]